jgi:hypothetical protein
MLRGELVSTGRAKTHEVASDINAQTQIPGMLSLEMLSYKH